MIEVIGAKRVFILALLIVVNVLLAAGIYLYMLPAQELSNRDLRNIEAEVAAIQSDINLMQEGFDKLDEQQGLFNKLKAGGVFNAQTRSDAKTLLSNIQTQAKVISATASVHAGIIEESEFAQKAGHKVLMSPIDIDVRAFDDADIYRYLEIAFAQFPGHLSLENIRMARTRDVDATVLRAIASGLNPELVSANIKLSWRTLIPESAVLDSSTSQSVEE